MAQTTTPAAPGTQMLVGARDHARSQVGLSQ